jgi:hypothetical protein
LPQPAKSKSALTSIEKKEAEKIARMVATYNMLPNLFWTILFLFPITLFCYTLIAPKTVFILLGTSLVPLFFPNAFFDAIQLSGKPNFYKRIGVRHINKFTQNGTLLHQYLRKKYPKFKAISINRASIKKQYVQTYFFEKFHFSSFIFFTAITILALAKRYPGWALILSGCNLFYNIYPNLLQQYIRLKLASAIKKA